MRTSALLVLSVLAMALLAGCSDAPPKGDLAAGTPVFTVEGTAAIDYTAASYPAGQVPAVGTNPALCPPPGTPLPQCVPAASTIKVHFMALPTPGSEGYHAYLTGAAARDLGELKADAANMWELGVNLTEDLTGQVTSVELRTGDLVLATAAGGEGTNPFAVADAFKGVTATGSYKGKMLNVTVSGLPANGTYMGRLYTMDPESGLLSPGDFFPITPGQPTMYKADLNIAKFAEFHVHVGSSSINVYKTTLPAK